MVNVSDNSDISDLLDRQDRSRAAVKNWAQSIPELLPQFLC